jgi:hypothetical protein
MNCFHTLTRVIIFFNCVIIYLDLLHVKLYAPGMAYIHVNPYKSSYFAAKQELEQRKAEMQFVAARIAQLEETIRMLEPLANEDGAAPTSSLPDLCRQILMSKAREPFTAGQVMETLTQMGVDISGYSQPLAVLHTTLTRICKPGSGFFKAETTNQPLYMYDETQKIRRFPRIRRQ